MMRVGFAVVVVMGDAGHAGHFFKPGGEAAQRPRCSSKWGSDL